MYLLHASVTEYLIFFGTAVDSAGHSGIVLLGDQILEEVGVAMQEEAALSGMEKGGRRGRGRREGRRREGGKKEGGREGGGGREGR